VILVGASIAGAMRAVRSGEEAHEVLREVGLLFQLEVHSLVERTLGDRFAPEASP